MTKITDRTGQRYGRLIANDWFYKHMSGRNRVFWRCTCNCGNTIDVETSRVGTKTRSCGCLQKESRHTHTRTHGKSRTRTHNIWKGMRKRCTNKNEKSYPHYGGRGITVCERWNDYANFLADMGEAPNGHSIDRINNSLGYMPENCRWADHRTQLNNRRNNLFLTHNGETLTASQWAEKAGIPYHTFWQRLYRLDWPLSRALVP